MESLFEPLGGTYTRQGDYCLPDVCLPPEEERPIGVYGQRRRAFLKAHHRVLYYNLLTAGTLDRHLTDIEEQAQELNKQVCGNCYNYEYDGFVFVNELGERMRVEYLTNAFPKFLESHGLRRMRFHDLRHSCASLLLANGVPLKHIQEWLGHSDFTTTANIYAHLDYKSKITSAQAMETGLALPEGGDFSSRWGSIGAGENF